MTTALTKEVQFNGQTLIGIINEDTGKIYTGFRKICENLGIDWSGQLKKVKSHIVLNEGVASISTVSNNRIMEIVAYDIDYLPTWLLAIKPSKIKEELRPMLITYQKEAVKVLRDTFIKKQEVKQDKPLSLSEMLLAQAQLNVDLEKKLSQVNNQMLEVKNDVSQFKSEVSQVNSHVSNLDQQVKQILEQKEEGLKKLDCIEHSETLPLFKTERTKVRQLVNAYAGAFNCSPKEVWNKLYTEFYYRYKRNIKLLADNRNMKPLDFVESSGLMEDLYNLASNLLRV